MDWQGWEVYVGVWVGMIVRKPSVAVRSFAFLGFQSTHYKTAITGRRVWERLQGSS